MRYLLNFFAILIFLLINGCVATQFHYTSSANIAHYSSSTETVMNVVLNETNNSREYGVLTAVDDETNKYLLVAPKKKLVKFKVIK